jgi:predicted nuclease of restriction endonuclease-like (RecB) superfamily
MNSDLDKGYVLLLQTLKEKIREARLRASVVVNAQLLQVYWEIGQIILEQQSKEGWGAKIIERLASDLKIEFEDMKGLSVRNLKYMRAFAEAYPQFVQPTAAQMQSVENQSSESVQSEIAQLGALVSRLPWTHNIVLLEKLSTVKQRLFYANKCIQNGWSKSILVHQIESDLYNRQGNAISNFELTLPKYQSDLAKETFKNPYLFDFLGIGEEVHERELEKALAGIQSPIGVAKYELMAALPKQFETQMPTVEELEAELQKDIEIPQTPLDEKLATVRKLIDGLKGDEIKSERDNESTTRLFNEVLPLISQKLENRLKNMIKEFRSHSIGRSINDRLGPRMTSVDLEAEMLTNGETPARRSRHSCRSTMPFTKKGGFVWWVRWPPI